MATSPSKKVFLAHASEDKPEVRKIRTRLLTAGHEAWLDEADLLPGQDWNFEIRKALALTDCVVVCLSQHSVDKIGYVQKEIKRVLDIADEYPEGSIFVIPVRLENCEVPPRLRNWQYVDADKPGWFKQLLASIEAVRKR